MWKGGNKNKKNPTTANRHNAVSRVCKIVNWQRKDQKNQSSGEEKERHPLYLLRSFNHGRWCWRVTCLQKKSLTSNTQVLIMPVSHSQNVRSDRTRDARWCQNQRNPKHQKKIHIFSSLAVEGRKKKKKKPPSGVVKAKSQMFAKSTFQIHFDLHQVTSLSDTQTEAIQFIH